ncbi:hypothetical protein BGZ68_000833 [Mortierella alpina]|nr:hypothetical protein BGZ68_000833 [Mortierella alpina]
MSFSPSQHSQHSQQPQHPYNPYPHQHQHHQHQPTCPQYTLRSSASLAAASARDSASSSEPPQDMFFALERLLMGISPFPPSMPTNLAEPTCPSLDDQTMSEVTPSSSSLSPSTSSAPSEPSDKHPGESLAQFYDDRESRPQQQPQSSYQAPRLQYRQQLAGSECSARSMSPPASPYSCMSSSPAMKVEASSDMPYWSPSTPSLQIDHQWSNHSSPLLSQQQQPVPTDQKHPSDSWGYPLFEQMNFPMSMPDLGNCVAPSACQHTASSPKSAQSYNHSMSSAGACSTTATPLGTVPLNARRAARTPPHRRTSSELSGLRVYESMAYRDYNPHRYYRNATSATSSSSSSTHNNSNNNRSSNNGGNGSYDQSSAGNNNNSSNSSNSNHAAKTNYTRGGVKSYPCPTCTKPFPTRTQLKSHMAIHTDNFPFPCLYAGCDLHFKRKHDLRRHVDAKHALVKKYLCSGGCGEGFGRRDQMVRHLRRGACGQGFQTE